MLTSCRFLTSHQSVFYVPFTSVSMLFYSQDWSMVAKCKKKDLILDISKSHHIITYQVRPSDSPTSLLEVLRLGLSNYLQTQGCQVNFRYRAGMTCNSHIQRITPLQINMEPKNHPIEKENYLWDRFNSPEPSISRFHGENA